MKDIRAIALFVLLVGNIPLWTDSGVVLNFVMMALYACFFLHQRAGVDPYTALLIVPPAFFVLGYALQRYLIAPLGFGKDINVLLVTLGISIILDNLALYLWTSNTRNIDIPQAQVFIELGMISLALPKVIGVVASIVVGLLFWLLMTQTDLGKAIRAVARERRGARIVGISVDHIFAMSFGIGSACIAVAACLLIPTYYVTPKVGDGFVLIAFTTVVLGGMGSFIGALVGGLFLGVVEAWSGLWLGESLGQIGVFIIFILVLLFKPNGLFGQRNT
jgi:branched-chain amino acid transport system permease protein